MKTLREMARDAAEEHYKMKYPVADGFHFGFLSGFKAAIEMLRSEEAELYQNEEREFYKQRVSPREWADYLEKMEKAE